MAGGGDLVYFSQGAPGTRAKLWARVCQYLRTPEQCAQCINQDLTLRGELTSGDYYAEAPSFDLPSMAGGGSEPDGMV